MNSSDLQFVHLHNHSEYSLLDGAIRTQELIKQAKEYDMPAVAITDHGFLYGIIDFYKQAHKAGINPIIGCEVYVTPNSRFEKNSRERYHLVLLAENNQGYQNLIKIVSKSCLEGFYYKPRVDKELLYEYHQGIICLSACIQGEISQLIINDQLKKAEELTKEYSSLFAKDNFFLELQDHNLATEKIVNSNLIQIANKLDLPLVITNDCHYLKKEDSQLHEVLLALQTGKTLRDEERMTFPNDQFYFKSATEMYQLFPQLKEAFLNTVKIGERCQVKLDFNSFYLPSYPEQTAESPERLLRSKCLNGLKNKGLADHKQAQTRLDYELRIIEKMGYVSYFLIVWDFIDYAQKQGIRVGPGRGSAAGSLVSYLLGITKINPLKYNLIFERFLNPERVTMPDIDIDFDEQRDEIIAYVKKRYGEAKVAQIGTFGTMAARAAIRDIGRVLDLPLHKVDKIAKMVPAIPGIKLAEALENSLDLINNYQEDKEVKKLLDYAQGVEGMPRHISTHAAGVIIGPRDLSSIIPLQFQDNNIITQLPMGDLEALGLLKMDFLGLRNLTVISKSLELIKEKTEKIIDIDNIPLDDPKVYQLLQQGKTLGVFQMESHLFQDLNQRLKPDRFTDLIALLALGRPGPLGSNLVEQYIDVRHGKREAEYLHPSLEPILAETFGLILYQEQVMEIASQLAAYTMGEADLLRRGMGKKKQELVANERKRFVQGAKKQGIKSDIANQIFDQMEYFSGYGFNKSHSAAYALLAYQTAYLKANYPAEFMAALISTVMSNQDKVASYIRECKEMNIKVLPPDINESNYEFKSTKDGNIRFGLKAIKNVGGSAIEAIMRARSNESFHSFKDFISRVDSRVNLTVIEALIKVGAFSSFKTYRSQLLIKYEEMYQKHNSRQRNKLPNQRSFFDLVKKREDFFSDQITYPDIEELSLEQILAQEKEHLGIYLSAHPLDQYIEKIKVFTNSDSENFAKAKENHKILSLAGVVVEKKEHIDKRQQQMAFLTIEDWYGKFNVVIFNDLYELLPQSVLVGDKLLLIGQKNKGSLVAQEIILLEKDFLLINIDSLISKKLKSLKDLFQKNKGETPLYFKTKNNLVLSNRKYWAQNKDELKKRLIDLLGNNSVSYY